MKVQIFSGRIHHWLKLRNVYRELEERGHDVSFLIANNAINIDPPSEYLTRSVYRNTHVYPYITNMEYSPYNPSSDNLFASIPPFWWLYSTRELEEVKRGVAALWDKEGNPDAVLVLHENNFWTKLIAWLCKQRDVPCYSFQEGLLRHRDQETMNKQAMASEYSSGLFVWTERDKQAYIDAGVDEDKVDVVGCSHLDKKWLPERNLSSRPIVLLALPSLAEYVGDMMADVMRISSYCEQNNFHLVVRFHPFEKHLADQFPKTMKFDLNDDPLPSLVSSRLILGQHSTIMLEAVLLGIPAAEYNFSNKPLTEPLSDRWLVDSINQETLDKIKNIIQYGISDVRVDAINAIRVSLNGVNEKIVDILEARNG